MAHLILLRNPLTPHEREEHELAPGETPIEWLQENYPTGFGMPIRYYVNADELPLDDLDRMPDTDDIVIIALMPGGFLAAMPLLVKVVIGLAVMAASFFAMQLFAPKPEKHKEVERRDPESISGDQNGAKLGDPIPVVYGSVWMMPDYVSQPYTWFSWGESGWNEWLSGIQYLDVIMCVGQGSVSVSDVKVGDSSASSLGSDIVLWRTFQPWEHNSIPNIVPAGMGGGFQENVVTNLEVGNQEFIKQGDTTPFYTICKAGTTGRQIQIDLIWPNGLYYVTSKGNTVGTGADYWVHIREVDADGNLIGPVQTHKVHTQTNPPHLGEGKNVAEVASPVRRTWTIDAGRSSRWAVRLERINKNFDPKDGQSNCVWSGLKLIGDLPSKVYGDVTLLAVRVKASRGIGSDASVRIQARCHRNSNGLPNGEWIQSTNPADAFYDIYTNRKYGAARDMSELDLATIRGLKSTWAAYQFNYVFRNRTTVWDALKTSVLGMAAEPLPLGSQMSIAMDGVKPTRSMLFTDANIVEGSMKINYIFDVEDEYDGIEVKYINPVDWIESFTRYPSNSVIPQTVELAGCTNATHAAQYARLVWQRTRQQRKRITFDTEMEGIILQLGDRIAVSHEMPQWGDSGLVIGVNGGAFTVDHDLDWSGSGTKYMMFRLVDGSASGLYTVVQGSAPNIALIQGSIPFTISVDNDFMDYTSFSFGSSTSIVRDFTVASTKHNGETTVTIEAVSYVPEIFDGAMSFLGGKP